MDEIKRFKIFWYFKYSKTSYVYLRLEKVVSIILFGKPRADPNATAAKGALPGTVPGSTPPVLLAATRGYYKVFWH